MIGLLVSLAIAGAAGLFGYVNARQFVRRRLRFVNEVQNPVVPVVAGAGAALVAAPVVWLLPVVGAGTAVVFGIGVGVGVAQGARDVKRLPPSS